MYSEHLEISLPLCMELHGFSDLHIVLLGFTWFESVGAWPGTLPTKSKYSNWNTSNMQYFMLLTSRG